MPGRRKQTSLSLPAEMRDTFARVRYHALVDVWDEPADEDAARVTIERARIDAATRELGELPVELIAAWAVAADLAEGAMRFGPEGAVLATKHARKLHGAKLPGELVILRWYGDDAPNDFDAIVDRAARGPDLMTGDVFVNAEDVHVGTIQPFTAWLLDVYAGGGDVEVPAAFLKAFSITLED